MAIDTNLSVVSSDRISNMIQEAENELIKIKPEIDYLEDCQNKLRELKNQQYKLQSLIISLKSVLKVTDVNNTKETKLMDIDVKNNVLLDKNNVLDNDITNANMRNVFLPDQAISQVKNYLRTKNNMNYEIFKAVVFNSGIASTQEIKNYLIETEVKQPKTGKGFDNVELKEISSRANYLVRKGVLTSLEPGNFRSVFGWCEI